MGDLQTEIFAAWLYMGIYIKIAKYKIVDDTGYYQVSTNDFGGAHFYIGINKNIKKISFYAPDDLINTIGEIDCVGNQPINSFGNIPITIIGRVTMKAVKVFDLDCFPNYLSYEA